MLEGVDVVLLDRGLPDGDGLEFIGALRGVNTAARVFVISSTEEVTHPTDAMEAGVDGVIDKFDSPGRVFAAIREPGAGKLIHPSAWRNCLENRNESRIGAPKAAKSERRELDLPPLAAKNTRSRSLQLFSKQFGRCFLRSLYPASCITLAR